MKRKLSIMVGVLNEEEGLAASCDRILRHLDSRPDWDFELLVIDDGSTDASWERIQNLSVKDSRVRGIRLSRNYGNHAALLAGLTVVTGDYAMNLAADLQTPLELVDRYLKEVDSGKEVVFGARRQRSDSGWDLFFAKCFYRLMNLLTPQKMPMGGIDSFIISRKVINTVNVQYGKNTSILGLIMNLGFRQGTIEYDRPPRSFGKSKWTLSKKIHLFLDGIFAFSDIPLRLCYPVAMIFFLIGAVLACIGLWGTGWAMSPWLFLSGVAILLGGQFLGIAVLGEYLYRALLGASRQPAFIISEEIGSGRTKPLES